jgi:putative chitinase
MSEDWLRVFKNVSPKGNMDWMASAAKIIEGIGSQFGINDINSMSHLIGHMAEETMGFTTFEESMNYSAKRLNQVWPSRFPTIGSALPYEHNPQKLANKVYGGRMGNTGPNDGWLYRGSGPLQHTGRAEFERVKRRTGVDVVASPDLLRSRTDARTGLLGAASYFVDRGALAPAKRNDVTGSTKAINGGTIGLADRKIWIERARKALILGDVIFDTVRIALERSPVATTEHLQRLELPQQLDPVDHDLIKQNTSAEKHLSAENNKVKVLAATPFLAGAAGTLTAATTLPLSAAAVAGSAVFVLGLGAALALHKRHKDSEPLPRFVQFDQLGLL